VAVPVETEPVTKQDTTEAEKAAEAEDISAAAEAADEADEAVDAKADAGEADAGEADDAQPADVKGKAGVSWTRVLVYGVLPALALLLAAAAGYLKWRDASVRDAQVARVESVHAATDDTVALLSYRPDTVEKDLGAARDRLTGTFRDSYTALTHDVVIPGAKQKQISATATVPAAASVLANPDHAVVLVFVDQTIIVGNDAPTSTASSVRVILDKIGGRWLISGFDPV
jgi:Mce-associated membrane protein